MSRKASIGVLAIIAAAVAIAVVVWLGRKAQSGSVSGSDENRGEIVEMPSAGEYASGGQASAGAISKAAEDKAKAANEAASNDGQEDEEPLSEEELIEREEIALVDAFDALTDKWMEPSKGGVTMKDVDDFSAQFRKVPKSRKEECLQRALNLVPDENVMLLAGILMDKAQENELVEMVFNDMLNRNDEVKKPILQEIFKDRTHPCWADTAWILDVTGELPERKDGGGED
jgi:hypothetical protein